MNAADTSKAALLGLLIVALVVNFGVLKFFDYPIVYCWGRPIAAAFYEPFSAFINLAVVAYAIYKGVMRQMGGFLIACGILVLVYGLPTFADTVLRLGGSC